MDRFLTPMGGKKTSADNSRRDDVAATSTAAEASSENGSSRASESTTTRQGGATAGGPAREAGPQPAAKKHKPMALKQLRGKEPSGRKPAGLSPALKEQLLARPLSKKRQLDSSLVGGQSNHLDRRRLHRFPDENRAPSASSSSSAAERQQLTSKPNTVTEKIRLKRRLAAAAATAAERAGWYDMPSGRQDRRSGGAPAAAAAVQVTPMTTAPPPSPPEVSGAPPPAGDTGKAGGAAAAAVAAAASETSVAAAAATAATAAATAAAAARVSAEAATPRARARAAAGSTPGATARATAATTRVPEAVTARRARATPRDTRPSRNASERAREPAAAVAPLRAGRMEEFFPRKVMYRSANTLPVRREPSSSSYVPTGVARRNARPLEGRRYARSRSRDDSSDLESGGESDCEGRGSRGPGDDHRREGGEEGGLRESDGTSGRGSGGGARAGATAGDGGGREPPALTAVSTPTAFAEEADAAAKPVARTEMAARAARAAERRAASAASATASSDAGVGHQATTAAGVGSWGAAQSGIALSDTAFLSSATQFGAAAASGGAAAAAGGLIPEAMAVGEETDTAVAAAAGGVAASAEDAPTNPSAVADEGVDGTEGLPPAGRPTAAAAATAVAEEVREASGTAAGAPAQVGPWPCRRRRGAPSLFLSQRQRTGGLRCRGVGIGDAGRDTFRRQALSTVLGSGLRTQRLRMGCVSNSGTASGVVRGHPASQGLHGRIAGGVSCMEFDSVGWQLAVGGENVTVYDFDRYLPENQQVKRTLESGVRAYLQPTDGIQTKRTVSCVRWNPANGDQLAVSYLNFDEVEVYDLTRIHPDRLATPVLTLLPGSGSAAVTAAPHPQSTGGGAFGIAGGGGASFGRFRGGGVSSSSSSSSLSGKFRGVGHVSLEFV
ncbi:unnamed protein product, partial [Ectocarpus sp. 4 AP-2014]